MQIIRLKRLGILGLVFVLVFTFSFVGCKKKDKEVAIDQTTKEGIQEATQWQGFVLSSEQVKPVWIFPDKTSKPWGNVEPFINPMGDETAYDAYSHDLDGLISFQGYDQTMSLYDRYFYGETFELTVPHRDDLTAEQNRQFVMDLLAYIDARSGEVVAKGQYSVLFYLLDEDMNKWWCSAADKGYGIDLRIVKERELVVDRTMTIHPAELKSPYYFASYHDGAHLYGLEAEISGGDVQIAIESHSQFSDYSRRVSERLDLSETVGLNYAFGDLPSEPGVWIWELYWHTGEAPEEITLTLTAPLPMEEVQYGEALGAIKVSAAYASHLKAEPTGKASVYIEHPDFSEEGQYLDRTADGDYLLYVPSGYWDVQIYPEGKPVLDFYNILAVPVSAGQVTEVLVPYGIASRFSAKAQVIDARGIDIGHIAEDEGNNTVAFEFSILDRSTTSVLPNLDNTVVTEGGQVTKLVKLEPVTVPPSLVILLDSSGSMKGSFSGVMASARSFIEGLPDDAQVQVVDFDSTVKVLKGKTKAEALNGLSQMKVDGDTALYDSLIQGIALLKGASRPMIVLFTDGQNDLPKGKGATKDQVISALKNSTIPVFTIGFGKGHDSGTLLEVANESYGKYFSAEDQDMLKAVFKAIQERISNTYKVVYERPLEASLGDIPVVTFMIDSSGSMSEIDEGIGERMRNLKNLIIPFVYGLPREVQVQLMGFEDSPYGLQSLTTDKTRLIRAIDYLNPGGGTRIPNAVMAGIESLKNIPSTKKILILVTDATLNPDEANMPELFKTLKDENILVLWVGMGLGDEVEPSFQKAATLSGGRYVISSDPIILQKAFDDLIQLVLLRPDSGLSQIALEIEKETDLGDRESFGASTLAQLSPVKASNLVYSSETVRIKSLGPLAQYDAKMAQLITGTSLPASESIITKRLALDKTLVSETVKIDAAELVFLSKLSGVEAPAGHRFMAVALDVENVMKEQDVVVYADGSNHPSQWIAGGDASEIVKMIPSYLIPDFSAHFFVSFNGSGSYAASPATWLLAQPLVAPGDKGLLLAPKVISKGALVFLVPDAPINQLSLHLYDVAHGSVHMPLVGKMPPQQELVHNMPTDVKTQLADSFDLRFVKLLDHGLIAQAYSAGEGNLWRQIEGAFVSNMQALLEFNPSERMALEIDSGSGSYYIPLHPVTTRIPLGQYHPKMIGPGAMNLTRWVFEMPKALSAMPANLYMNLSGEDARLKVQSGLAPTVQEGLLLKGKDLNVRIHSAVILDQSVGLLPVGSVLMDLTLYDKEDGFSTAGVYALFDILAEDSAEAGGGASIAYGAERLILGFKEDDVVFDGTARRGFLVYDNSDQKETLILTSSYFQGFNQTVVTGSGSSQLLTTAIAFEKDDTYDQALSDAVSLKISQYSANHAKLTEGFAQGTVPLKGSSGVSISTPTVGVGALQRLKETDDLVDLRRVLKSLYFLPSDRSLYPFEYLYSPEATLTQGFGTENDYANVALSVLAKQGYKPKAKLISLTEKGKEALTRFSGGIPFNQDTVPGVYYEDKTGPHILVLPFVELLEDLDGLAFYSAQQYIDIQSDTVDLKVSIHGYSLMADRNEHVSDMGDALAGDTEGGPRLTTVDLLSETLPLDQLSRDAIDVGFAKMGVVTKAYLLIEGKTKISGEGIWAKDFEAKHITVTLDTGRDTPLVHTVTLDGKRTLEDIFMTLSINCPEIPKATGEALAKERLALETTVDQVDDLSAMRWFARSRIQEFVKAQTAFEREAANTLDLIIGNTNAPRVVVMTLKAPVSPSVFEASISLLNPVSDVHLGKPEAMTAFQIMSGLNATALEERVLGEKGIGSIDILAAAPKGTSIVLMESHLSNQSPEILLEAGMSPFMIDYFRACPNYILIPDKPSVISGVKRWAWLEIEPDTYRVLGVMDSLEKGAMVETVIVDTVKGAAQYAVGAFVGVGSSIWAVAGVSLKEDDYKTILKEAKAIALGMKDSFGIKSGPVTGSIGGKLEISQTFGPVKAGFDGGTILSQDVLGFTQGYEAGVNHYFSEAE
jgi:Mg-chelatase subunit ChlD